MSEKLTIDKIIIYEEPIKQRSCMDAYLLFKRKRILERKNFRAVVYVREKLINRQYFTLDYIPGFFNLNPGDVLTYARLVDLEDKHRQKVKNWVELNNSKYIITEPNCACDSQGIKVHSFTLKQSEPTKPLQIN